MTRRIVPSRTKTAEWKAPRALAVTVAAVTLLLTGCSGSGGATSADSQAALRSINDRDPTTLMDCGDLRLPITQFPKNFNPLWAGTPSDFANLMRAASYPRAFSIQADGSLALDTDYFTSVQETAADPQVITYTINPQAQWSDGTPITWEDIRAQAHALSGTDPRYQPISTAGYDRILSVERGANDRQAIVTYRAPFAEWRAMLSGYNVLLPQSITAQPDTFISATSSTSGPSAGPFLIANADPKDQQIRLLRNPKWWGRKPRLASVTLVTVDPHGTSAALHDNKIDALDLSTAMQVAAAERIPGMAIRRSSAMAVWGVFYSASKDSVLSDAALRRAITRGIDRKTIVDVTQRGLTDNPTPSNNHLFANGQTGYRDNSAPYDYDSDQANRDLDALGWKRGDDGWRYKDGQRLRLLDYYIDSPADDLLAQLLQNSLDAIGVDLEINDVAARDAQTYRPAFDLIQDVRYTGPFPLSIMASTLRSGAMWNLIGADNPALDDKIAKTLDEPGEGASAVADSVDKQLWLDGYSVPLVRLPGITAVRGDLANYGAFGQSDIDFTAVGYIPGTTSC
ncbi:ABC-type dipeptide transport system, periplasmic component (plasmid) [Mycobacterium sp. JS623]|uniref:ABC transporter family substrate-binding protein n=1 Tax=Mycobacterium sp. JS623 TaxID=212767 RepID=UPI0002A5AC81|nr:ABC transporter family substrate-binding protein [Mycobacterium sp. JS623]AGB26710.1 ABC-type dipeptide transport system, periplasmic component [Mycobacterium sp. JS623]